MSVRLKSRTLCPPNGFPYFQPETGWTMINTCPACQWDFALAVNTIRAHRLANPRFNLETDPAIIAEELDHATALRVSSMRGADTYIIQDGDGGGAPPKLSALQRSLAASVGGVKKLSSGLDLLTEWLGTGAEPVPDAQADARAAVCAVCPRNGVRGDDWMAFFTKPAVALLQKMLGMRRDLGLKTAHDAKLGVCEACGCVLKLKVWVPLKVITDHQDKETEGKLHPACWIKSERH